MLNRPSLLSVCIRYTYCGIVGRLQEVLHQGLKVAESNKEGGSGTDYIYSIGWYYICIHTRECCILPGYALAGMGQSHTLVGLACCTLR